MRLWTPCKDDVFFSKISSSLIECFLTENEQLFAANSDGWVEAADEVFSIKFSLPRQNLSHLADWSVVTSEPSPCSLRVSYDFIIILSIKLSRQFFDRQTNNVSSRMSHISLSLRKIAWGNLEFMTRYTGKRPTNANSVQLTLKKMLYFTLPLARALTNIKINGHGLCYNYMCSTKWSHSSPPLPSTVETRSSSMDSNKKRTWTRL